MPIIKKVLIVLMSIAMLIGLAIYILTKNVTPTAIRNIINKELTNITSQTSHIDGNIAWQLFPRPGIRITQIHVGEPNTKPQFSVYIDNLLINLQITPLLRGQLVFSDLKVDGFKINVNPNAQTQSPVSPTVSEKTLDNTVNTSPATFAIKNLLLTKGQLIITQPNNKITLNNLQLGAKELNMKNAYFPIQIRANLAAMLDNNSIKTMFDYKGKIRLVPATLTNPLAELKHETIEGQLLAKNTRINQFKIAKINTNAVAKQGEVILSPLNFSLYAGKATGDLHYHLVSQKLSINQTATGLDASQIFNALSARNLVKGNLDFSIHAQTNLQNSNWLQSLQGNGNLSIKDGSLFFIDLTQLISQTTNSIHNLIKESKEKDIQVSTLLQLSQGATQPGTTKFELISTQYRFTDEKLINDSILLQMDKLQLKGNSEMNLRNNQIDGNLFAKLMTNDKTVESVQQMLGGSFPLKLTGTFDKPLILPNANEINPILAKYVVKKTLEKPIKEIKHQIEGMISTPENLFHDSLE